MAKSQRKSEMGFSLLELVVAVAIVGILATAGIPAYLHMIGNSKQAEAKTELGQIASLESGFYATYNSYGDNLAIVGYKQSNYPANLTYAVGFPSDTSCDDLNKSQLSPPYTTLVSIPPKIYTGTSVLGTFGSFESLYYSFPDVITTDPTVLKPYLNPYTNQYNMSVFGKASSKSPIANAKFKRCQVKTKGEVVSIVQATCQISVGSLGAVSNDVGAICNSDGGAKSYQAGAFGCLKPGEDPTSCGADSNVDIWTINNFNHLFNVQNGL